MTDALTAPLMMVGGAVLAIALLMLVAKVTALVNPEEKQGRKPVYSMEATVKGKRLLLEADENNPQVQKTVYFLTFQKQDGNRVELQVPGEDYGLAAEGDVGVLVWQGDAFVVFKRNQ